MLRELRIRNFAILGEATLEFRPGLNVITGETGAGKSVLLDALGVALGDRASRDRVRSGRDEAVVELLLDTPDPAVLSRIGIDPGEDLIIRRHIASSGKSRIYLSGALSTVQNLRDVLSDTVDVHGQFEYQALLMESRQLRLLDTAAGHGQDIDAMVAAYASWKEAEAELESFRARQRDIVQRGDLLRYQVEEIEAAALIAGEDERLESEKARLSHTERLVEAAMRGRESLYAEDRGALDGLYAAAAALERIREIDPGAAGPVEGLREAIVQAEEAGAFFRNYGEALEHEPGSLDGVMLRLDMIDRLKGKYGSTIDDVVRFGEKAAAELRDIENPEARLEELESARSRWEHTYTTIANRVGRVRRETAKELAKNVETALSELAIPKGRFVIEVSDAQAGPLGRDRVRFLFSANQGEALQPLARIASGGELSRVMLAIKGVLGDTTPVLVFDEVDAGIGGEAARAVGRRLKNLAENRQVVCVTHQPIVAAMADHHLRIRKKQGRDETTVEVQPVCDGEREDELARMLSGSVSEVSREHARELLSTGRRESKRRAKR